MRPETSLSDDEINRLVAAVAPFSMVPSQMLVALARQTESLLRAGVAGDLVECGVWRGGSAFLMAMVRDRCGQRNRRVWLYDSFEGLPPPKEIDGPAATAWADQEAGTPPYLDNCRASVDEVRGAAASLGLDGLEIRKGWFEQTLPTAVTEIGQIALLRIDADWYSSVKQCLESLFDLVAREGIVVIDDYFAWDGCAIAVHEFLGQRRLPNRITWDAGAAVLRRDGARRVQR